QKWVPLSRLAALLAATRAHFRSAPVVRHLPQLDHRSGSATQVRNGCQRDPLLCIVGIPNENH
ncbi:MAG: hypothetical protein ABGY21_11355, partial [Pseudomonadota bacterium]